MTGEVGSYAGVEGEQREGPASSAQTSLVPKSHLLPKLLLPPIPSKVLVPRGQQGEVIFWQSPPPPPQLFNQRSLCQTMLSSPRTHSVSEIKVGVFPGRCSRGEQMPQA